MHDLGVLPTFAGALTDALMVGFLAHRASLSPIVGYLLAGVGVGPFTPGFSLHLPLGLDERRRPSSRSPHLAHASPRLTRRGDLKTKLAAFEAGVDDILTVPFSPEEFVARTMALMRRTYREAITFMPVLRLGDLEIDILNRRVRAGETELHLTSLEQSLLYLLAANAGRLLTRDEILDHLWGSDYVAESNLVDRHVHSLRVKLQNHARQPRYIATVPGRGYRFIPTTAAAAPSSSQP